MTSRIHPSSRRPLAFGAAAIVALLLAGCSSTTAAETGATSAAPDDATRPAVHAVDEVAAALVPESIRSDDKVVIAADATSAPDAFLAEDGQTLTGWQVDLAYQLTDVLGIEAEFVNTSIPTIIPGLENGRYEMGVATFGITPDRLEVLDFVGNFVGGGGFLAKAGAGLDFSGIDDLCGLTVGVIQGTLYVEEASAQSDRCTAAGRDAVDVQQFPDKNSAALALNSDRVDMIFVDGTTTGYMVVQEPGLYEELGEPFYLGVAGISFAKDSGMAEAVQAALQVLIDDGTYVETLAKYGVDSGAVSVATVNDPEVS
ncbi:MAG: transporter substrate-binding domain-containing protein [Pseudoclavibacter sp.]